MEVTVNSLAVEPDRTAGPVRTTCFRRPPLPFIAVRRYGEITGCTFIPPFDTPAGRAVSD